MKGKDGGGDVSYAIRFRALGERWYFTVGTASEGTTREDAEKELAYVVAQVERGDRQPPGPSPEDEAREQGKAQTFRKFAGEWWEAKRRELAPATQVAYKWHLYDLLIPFFGGYRLSQIDAQLVDRYKAAMLARRDAGARLSAGQSTGPWGGWRRCLSRPWTTGCWTRAACPARTARARDRGCGGPTPQGRCTPLASPTARGVRA
jgi:hypothetical protein